MIRDPEHLFEKYPGLREAWESDHELVVKRREYYERTGLLTKGQAQGMIHAAFGDAGPPSSRPKALVRLGRSLSGARSGGREARGCWSTAATTLCSDQCRLQCSTCVNFKGAAFGFSQLSSPIRKGPGSAHLESRMAILGGKRWLRTSTRSAEAAEEGVGYVKKQSAFTRLNPRHTLW